MVVIMKEDATEAQVAKVMFRIEALGSKAHLARGRFHAFIGVVAANHRVKIGVFDSLEGVERVISALGPPHEHQR